MGGFNFYTVNDANNPSNILSISGSGKLTVADGLTVSSGGASISGHLTVGNGINMYVGSNSNNNTLGDALINFPSNITGVTGYTGPNGLGVAYNLTGDSEVSFVNLSSNKSTESNYSSFNFWTMQDASWTNNAVTILNNGGIVSNYIQLNNFSSGDAYPFSTPALSPGTIMMVDGSLYLVGGNSSWYNLTLNVPSNNNNIDNWPS